MFCDTFVIPITITGGFVNIAPQLLIAKYARTWTEMSATGGLVQQVWRFLVNGDLVYTVAPGAPSPCPIPKIALSGKAVHFVGSIDYARNCQTGVFSARIDLVYLCGKFSHGPLSPAPITPDPNPDIDYAFVGPTPFVWGVGAPPVGIVTGESVRSTRVDLTAIPGLWQCLSEEPVLQGALDNVALYCPCADPTVPPGTSPWTEQKLTFAYGACMPTSPFTFMALPFPTLAPTGFSVMSLGTHALPITTFPDSRSVHFYFAVGSAPDPCVTGALPIHIINGVSTVGPLIGIGTPPPPGIAQPSHALLDIENTLVIIGVPPYTSLGYGALFLATQVWSLDLP